jgi:hypothetical protein
MTAREPPSSTIDNFGSTTRWLCVPACYCQWTSTCNIKQSYHTLFHITNFIQFFRFSFEWALYIVVQALLLLSEGLLRLQLDIITIHSQRVSKWRILQENERQTRKYFIPAFVDEMHPSPTRVKVLLPNGASAVACCVQW